MKKILLLLPVILLHQTVQAQSLNWARLENGPTHLVSLQAGWEDALVLGASYGYRLPSRLPVVLSARYSFPSGQQLLDDFKLQAGAQIRFYHTGNFQWSAQANAIYRRYQNPLVRLQNAGAELIATAGYYRPRWFAAGSFGFDRAIATHFKHSDSFRDNIFSSVQDGWQYGTGGHFRYGIQAGYSFAQHDISFQLGKVIAQDFKTSPLIPYYVQLAYQLRIDRKR
jgi:hypothetical protein